MAQKIYKTEDGQTIIANMMNDVTNVSFKDYILKFHSYSIAPVISNLAFKLFCFLPMDSIARIVSRQSFELAKEQLAKIESLGFGDLPVCMAKTQYSFSDDAKKLGAPTGFRITVRQLKVCAGAGFVVALTGNILTMPGLPKHPAAENIDVDSNGVITGLF